MNQTHRKRNLVLADCTKQAQAVNISVISFTVSAVRSKKGRCVLTDELLRHRAFSFSHIAC